VSHVSVLDLREGKSDSLLPGSGMSAGIMSWPRSAHTTHDAREVRNSRCPMNARQIRRRCYRYLRDIFRDLLGFHAAYSSTAQWGTSLVVRGLGGNHRIVFLLDGQRFNPPGGENIYGAFVARRQALIPNNTLRPETLSALELIWYQELPGHLVFTAGGFVNLVQDGISDATSTREFIYVDLEGGRLRQHELLQSLNIGRGTYYGGEAEALLSVWRLRSYANVSFSCSGSVVSGPRCRRRRSRGPCRARAGRRSDRAFRRHR